MIVEFSVDFLAGCIGGAAGVLAGHPFDTVKVRLQTQTVLNSKYNGTFHCVSTIVKNEGFRTLYRGISSPLTSIAFLNAITFGAHGTATKCLRAEDGSVSYFVHFVAGAAAGSAQSFLATPMEMLKLRAQCQLPLSSCASRPSTSAQHHQSLSPFGCFKKIMREKGARSLTRGLWATQLRDTTGIGTYFVSYEFLVKKISKDGKNESLNTFQLLMAGGTAGTLSWLCNYPVDVVKTRFQVDDTYKNYAQVIRQMVLERGWRCFFVGLESTLLRAFPTNAATFFTVEWTYRMIHNRWPSLIYGEKAIVSANYDISPTTMAHQITTRTGTDITTNSVSIKQQNNNQTKKAILKNNFFNRRYILLGDLWSRNSFLLPEAGSTFIDPMIHCCKIF